jgi:hypothetical protein
MRSRNAASRNRALILGEHAAARSDAESTKNIVSPEVIRAST